MAEWLERETENLLIAVGRRSNSRPSRIFDNSRLLSFFLIALSRALPLCSHRNIRIQP